MEHVLNYAINHTVAPNKSITELIALAKTLELDAIELRNDLPGVSITDTTPELVRKEADAAGVHILSINALQRFNDWNDARAAEARTLAAHARDCGAEMLVLCPVNEAGFMPSETDRSNALRGALRGLTPILEKADVLGVIEPLGFETSSLRFKSEAVEAIEDVEGNDRFRIAHDTFHHYLVGEPHLLPDWTALVHLSGVDVEMPLADLRDPHRTLIDAADQLGNLAQIYALLSGGYGGPFSFEPFSASIQNSDDIVADLQRSMHFIDADLAKLEI
ncbi:MAG: TIM barrel protein [Pseudomonadota bacterium]